VPCAKFLVSGKVQGVFFRASARCEALALEISGYAKNRADGRVEVLAYGAKAALNELEVWLKRGPPLAHVDEVLRIDIVEPLDASAMPLSGGFFIGSE
jgi:acylphosphatase